MSQQYVLTENMTTNESDRSYKKDTLETTHMWRLLAQGYGKGWDGSSTGTEHFRLPGQFAPWSESANKTLVNWLPETLVTCNFRFHNNNNK